MAEGAAIMANVEHKFSLISGIYETLVNREGGKIMQSNLELLGPITYTDEELAFGKKIQEATSQKINDIIIDPGFGFAKTTEQNYTLLNHLDLFQTFGLPILIGLSRKSMIYKILKATPQEALNGTTALHAIALLKGANIIRAHDVKEAVECVKLVAALKANAL